MATKKKLLQAAAGQAGGAGLNVEEVFSTYLYEGTGSNQTITNGIDLDGEGGLVWIKTRSNAEDHFLFDSVQAGVTYALRSNKTDASSNRVTSVTSFNSNGFSLGSSGEVNENGYTFASWTWRKAPRFFDCVTYTGNGTTNRQISHNLGSVPGCIIVKRTNGLKDWAVYHRGKGSTHYGTLNTSEPFYDYHTWWQDTDPTSTDFTVGNSAFVNANGDTYVAYLFAHNDGDGEFGPDGDADIIKCGSYTHSGSAWTEDLGFEPQFVISKNTTSTGAWQIVDNMRGLLADNGSGTAYARLLKAEVSNAESNGSGINITSTGLEGDGTGGGGSGTYIYIAIRRGPMAVPEDATDVFHVEEANNPNKFVTTGFVTDLALQKHTALSSSWYLADRLRGENKWLSTDTTGAELVGTDSAYYTGWDYMNGVDMNIYPSQSNDHIFHMWKRAPNYFDVVAYTGNGTAGRNISHNLGVAPEMMWVKKRSGVESWAVYHSLNGGTHFGRLQTSNAYVANSNVWDDTDTTASVFTVDTDTEVNQSGEDYIAYLFASLDGVSKVGSYTGNATGTSNTDTQNIECGFAPRFVLIKNTDGTAATGHWTVFDTERGIVAGNDPRLYLNDTSAEASYDYIDPYATGFTVTNLFDNYNKSNASYIFYAIA